MPFNKFWNLAPDNKDPNVLNMYVYGEICSASSFFGSEDDVVAGEFVKDLNKYPDAHVINVYINSPGGSVFAAAAIRNQLRNSAATVHTWCDGICASAAVGILLAADEANRHMSKASLLMIHNPSTRAEGDQKVFMKTADLLAKVKKTILNIYQEGTGLPEDQLSTMMDESTYLDADEAIAYHFVGKITENQVVYDFSDDKLVCNGISMDVAADLDIASLKNYLEQLVNKKKQTTTSILEEGGMDRMSFDDFLASLAEDQREQVQNMLNEHVETLIQDRVTSLNAEHEATVTSLQDKNSELEGTVNSLQEQLTAVTATNASPEDDIIKNMPPEAQALLAQARADAVAAQESLLRIQNEQEFAAFKESFAAFDKLPIQESHIKAMQMLAKNNESMFNDLRELLKVANNAMSSNYTPEGKDQGTDVATDAFNVMEQRISAYKEEHSDATYADAMRAVLREDPSLYDSYRASLYSE